MGTQKLLSGSLITDDDPLQVRDAGTLAALTRVRQVTVNVQGNTLVRQANAARLYLLLQNDSDVVIYVALGGTAAVNTGVRLAAGGGTYEMSPKIGNLYTGGVRAIHGGGAVDKVLLVTEGE